MRLISVLISDNSAASVFSEKTLFNPTNAYSTKLLRKICNIKIDLNTLPKTSHDPANMDHAKFFVYSLTGNQYDIAFIHRLCYN